MATLLAILLIFSGFATRVAEAQVSTPQPYELTSRGTIASDATERYRAAIEDCFKGQPGSAPGGSAFLACLEKQTRVQDATLNEIYRGTIGYLKSSPEKIARLQSSQRGWLQFRDANCAFARSVAPAQDAAKFFYDCVLRSIVERQAELRSLVGD
jgi:uncharacterized protein YecT (DUF1311 family)